MKETTLSDSDHRLIDLYMREVHRYEVLPKAEQIQLAVAAQAGCGESRQKLICANLRLVVKIANEYARRGHNTGYSVMDLVSEGNIGLGIAVDKFSVERGCAFSTVADIWIRQRIRIYISKHSTVVRAPSHVSSSARRVALGVANEEESRRADNMPRVFSIDAFVPGTDELSHEECDPYPTPAETVEQADMHEFVREAIDELPPRMRDIVLRRYGFQLDSLAPEHPDCQRLSDIASGYEVSRERIRMIQKDAINLLRSKLSRSPFLPSRRRNGWDETAA